MAGRGPAPKDPSKRARRNKDVINLREYQVERTQQPGLPTIFVWEEDEEGKQRRRKFNWPTVTKRWWKMWAESPLAPDFSDADWSFLQDTAYVHARYWLGDVKLAGELRLRVAKFGATPEDRARLRIVFAVADNVENGGGEVQESERLLNASSRDRARSRSLKAI